MRHAEAHHSSAPVRGRLAPSPTGLMHLGNAWAFLLAWLAARSAGGQVVLRLEDIDPERSRPAFAVEIQRDLRWLGLDWDEGPDAPGSCGPYEQGQRLDRYAAALDALSLLSDSSGAGRIYPCFCTRKELRSLATAPHGPHGRLHAQQGPQNSHTSLLAGDGSPAYPGTCRNLSPAACAELLRQGRRPALRLRCDDVSISFLDLVAGPQRMSLRDCGGDFAVRRSDGVFAYQLAVVLDDIAMGITQVVRGDDILTSTPRQIFLYRLLGAEPPQHAHLPLLLDAQGERLAKRHQSLTLAELREAGVSAPAIIGYLAWRAGVQDAPRPCTPQSLSAAFALSALPSGPVQLPVDITGVLRALG